MGTFFVEAVLAAPDRPDRRQPVNLLVDSGSTYTWVAAAVLRALSVVPPERRRGVTIEGQVVERDAAEVLITLEREDKERGPPAGRPARRRHAPELAPR